MPAATMAAADTGSDPEETMEPTAIAAVYAGASAAKVQTAAAMKMLKMNAEAGQTLVAMLEQSADDLAQVAREAAAGIGENLDLTV